MVMMTIMYQQSGHRKMIARLLKAYEEWMLPNQLLSRAWKDRKSSIKALKKYAIDTRAELDHLDWRVIDLYAHENGHTDNSKLSDAFQHPIIDIEPFRQKLSRVGVPPAKTHQAMSKWLLLLDQLHVHLTTSEMATDHFNEPSEDVESESDSTPINEKAKTRTRPAPKPTTEAEEPEFDEAELREEARKNLGIYSSAGETDQAPPLVISEVQEGLGPYRPVDVNNSFHNGFLYYPVQVINGKRVDSKAEEKIHEKIETVVVRSDRTLQRIVKSERLEEGHYGQDVLRLTDGTLINSIPRPNIHGTWQWSYIEAFINGDTSDIDLAESVKTIRQHLMSRVWLPFEADYTLLAMTAVATYVQSIFDSVPLILLVGPHGSGKSELGSAMSEASANATMIGQVSAPTMMRLIDESGGLCVIDDLESVGVSKTKSGNQKFSDLAQALKVSYKKSTASRMITNPQTRRTEVMNFYGIKLISNTKGADNILGSRMLHVNTKYIDSDSLLRFQDREGVSEEAISELRNKLHIWAFENVSKVHSAYLAISSKQSDRENEIAEPLRTIAKLTGDNDLILDLETALSAQSRRKNRYRTPEEVLKELIEGLVVDGYDSAAITHVMLELRREMDPGYEIDYASEMPGWSRPEWIGRKLREMGILSDSRGFRKRVKGQNLRFVKFKDQYVKNLRANKKTEPEAKKADGFCLSCESCPYAKHSCEIMQSTELAKAS